MLYFTFVLKHANYLAILRLVNLACADTVLMLVIVTCQALSSTTAKIGEVVVNMRVLAMGWALLALWKSRSVATTLVMSMYTVP